MKRLLPSMFFIALITAFAVFASFDRDRGRVVEAQQPTTGDPSIDALRESIGNFFETLSDNSKGPRKAVDDFVQNSPMKDNEKTKNKIIDGLSSIKANFGGYVAYEPVGTKMVGTDLIVFRYLYKCEDYPVVCYFTYYRPRSKTSDAPSNAWNLIGFRYDTNLDAALLDASFSSF